MKKSVEGGVLSGALRIQTSSNWNSDGCGVLVKKDHQQHPVGDHDGRISDKALLSDGVSDNRGIWVQ